MLTVINVVASAAIVVIVFNSFVIIFSPFIVLRFIDVIRADRRDADDLTAELLNKGEILGFGVADDDVILGDEEGVRHFTLGGEGLTGTGRTQDQPVGVLELLAVHHDHDDTVVEYALSRSMSPTMVAYYTLHLPDKAILQSKLRELTELALESGEGNEGDEE